MMTLKEQVSCSVRTPLPAKPNATEHWAGFALFAAVMNDDQKSPGLAITGRIFS